MDIAPLFCPFCRKELLEENTQFCGNCGRNLSLPTDPEEHTPTHKTIRPMPVLPESQTSATVVPHTPPPNNPSEYPPKRQPSPKRRNILKLGVIGVTSVAALSALGTGAFVVTHQQASQGHPTVTPTSQAATTLTPNGWEERSLARPALTVFNGQPYLAWTSIDNHIKIARCSNNSTSMSVTTLPSATSYQGSALAVFNNRLYVAWTGTDNSLNIASSSDGTTFTNSTKFSSSSQAPALTAFNNQLYLVWTGTDNILYVAGSSDGSSFVPIGLSGTSSQKAPGAIAFNNQLYVAWAGTDNLLHIVRLTPPFYVGVDTPGATTYQGPALTVFNNKLYAAWTGADQDSHLNMATYSNGSAFTPPTILSETSYQGPALTVFNNQLYMAWTGIDNLLHVTLPK